jgi:mRNA interferase MazF
MKRGEIYYIQHPDATGAEINKARPGVIVSNDALNQTSEVVEVVYLTTQPKKELPTHASIEATGRRSTALCEQINTVSILRVGAYCGTCSEEEMEDIDRALRASLDLAHIRSPREVKALRLTEEVQDLKNALASVITQRDRYARMLDLLLAEKEAAKL